MKALPALFALGLLTAGCASGPTGDPFAEVFGGVPADRAAAIASRIADEPFGSAENPVRVNMPVGERAYLARLRCANGQAPAFERIGSFGLGPYGQVLDGYQVDCAGSTPASSVIYLDMYHPTHIETNAPAGFTIVAP